MKQTEQDFAALQQHSADPSIRVSQLVREAMALAARVGDQEMLKWLRLELNGYAKMLDAPDYRWTRGSIRAWNPYRGWIPVIFPDPAEEDRVSRVATTQGVGEIEALLGSSRGVYGVKFPPYVAKQITQGEPYITDPMVHVPRVSLERVLDRVRNAILDWTIHHGAAAVPAPRAAREAADSPRVVISGSIVDSQVQIASSNAAMTVIDEPVDVKALIELIRELRSTMNRSGFFGDCIT